MGPKTSRTILPLLVVAIVFAAGVSESSGFTTNPIVNRVFYLSLGSSIPNILTPVSPSASSPTTTNVTRALVEFGLPTPLFSPATMSGQVTLALWLNVTANTTLYLNGTIGEKVLSNQWLNATLGFPPRQIDPGPRPQPRLLNFTGNVQKSLLYGDLIVVAISTKTIPKVNATMLWGASNYRSLVVLPLSGYIGLSSSKPLDVRDSSNNPTTTLDLNSTVPAVNFQAFVTSALGFQDVLRVNLTVVDPSLRPVRTGTNLSMTPFPPPQPPSPPPFVFTTTWIYPSNATEGVYQVYIDVFDVQGSRAFSFRGPFTFTLFRTPPLLRQPLNLIPYIAIGGVAIVGSLVYYRRRKTKSYLAPFDYFHTLTAGELYGGTVVTVEGNTGSGKTLLCEQLMFEDLKKGRPCVFVATGDFPSNIRANMKAMGLDITGYEQSGLVTFVDGYSGEAGQESREKFAIPSLGDLTTLGIKISSSLPPESFKGGSLYFDSLTPLASKTKPESIVSFVQSLGARVRGMGGKVFFTVGPSVNGNVQRQLEEMADCVVQMEAFEESGARKSRLRISKYRARRYQQGWVLYTIEEGKGMIFYSRKPRK